ncbi:MAG: prepilin-type N-terminal cleavage/methylation domain-containing protein [Gammaproteobacteria bacterium]|nr:prepilin-type N-terminal cleavage/methylation domain-containing protein [Gammaproteobacteria bacterium]MDH5803097.1 prepilin-type N-terminal cleavage/methylation domain-containing protein [Gammaproteobacteria bacterium]
MKKTQNRAYQKGITMLESLIAIAVLAVGMLSMLQYSSNTMLTITNNGVRAMALKSAAEQFVLMQLQAANNLTNLKDALVAMHNGGNGTPITTADNQRYHLSILEIRGGYSANAILTTNLLAHPPTYNFDTDTTNWESPLTAGIKVVFTDSQGNTVANYVPVTIPFK